jgi:Peptidase A4 family
MSRLSGRWGVVAVAVVGAILVGSGVASASSNVFAGQSPVIEPWATAPSTSVTGCGALHLLVPTETASYYAANPSALLPPIGSQVADATFAEVRRAARTGVHWLTTISCTNGHRGVPAPELAGSDMLGTKAGSAATSLSCPPVGGICSASNSTVNWSGYEAARRVLGTTMEWYVPYVGEPSNKTVVSSVWPGMGLGSSDSDALVQAGTEQDGACEIGCTYHKTSYYAWIEIVPDSAEPYQQEITNLTVAPNNDIAVIVEYNLPTKQAYFEVINYTTNDAVAGYEPVPGSAPNSGSAGEWILERTESGGNLPSLSNFGSMQVLTPQAAVGSSWSSYTTDNAQAMNPFPIYMTDCAGLLLDTVEEFGNTAYNVPNSFSLLWNNYGPTDPFNC